MFGVHRGAMFPSRASFPSKTGRIVQYNNTDDDDLSNIIIYDGLSTTIHFLITLHCVVIFRTSVHVVELEF